MNCQLFGKLNKASRLIHQRIKEQVEPLWMPNVIFGHGFDHAERVYERAIAMGDAERADLLILGVAAYLMDAGLDLINGRKDHVSRSMVIASEIATQISELAPRKDILLECIQYHEAEIDIPDSVSIESKILHDSDTLDRMGFTGIAMTIEYGNWVRRDFCAFDDPFCLVRKAPEHEACCNTIEYIIYTQKLNGRLVLVESKKTATRKYSETKTFLSHMNAQLEAGIRIDHLTARRILEELCPHNIKITPTSL
jgi:HD superfamily phosphodiesterase